MFVVRSGNLLIGKAICQGEIQMKWNHTNLMLMVASGISVFASGCVTGTNTFSRIGEPTTEYCDLESRSEPIFDVVTTRHSDITLSPNEDVAADGQKISFKP